MSGAFNDLALSLAAQFRPGGLVPEAASWSLASIVAEICTRAGVPPERIGFASLAATVDGFYMTADNDAFTGVEALSSVYFFDVSNHSGMLYFTPRGGLPVATITDDDLVDEDKDTDDAARGDSITVPRVLHLEYYDYDGGLTPDKQTSDRSLDGRAKQETKDQTVVILRAADAAKVVAIRHKVSIEEQRGEHEFSLPDNWLHLTVGDVIVKDGQRLRITECEVDEAQQNYKAVYDRVSSYTSTMAAVPVQVAPEPPTLVIGDTVMHFIDSHILRDADDRLGYYVAINSASAAWTGALVELSLDGGATYVQSLSGGAWAEMGELETDLPAHAHWYPDRVNALQVRLIREDDALESTTQGGMQNRINLAIVGDELINFGDVDELEPGLWSLTNLLRGRKGTAAVAHSAGTRFVRLARSDLFFIDADTFSVGRTLTFRATSFGGDVGVVSSYTFTGRSQIERQPGYLAVQRTGGNLVISWQGAGRVGGGVLVSMGVHFAGYRVTVNGTAYDTAAQTYTVTDPGGSVTVTVQQRNTLTGLGPAAEIIL